MFDALGALFEHLHLLVAERHVVEQDEQVEAVSAAQVEVHHVHDPVRLLQQVKRLLVLLPLDELNARVIQLSKHYRNLVL